MFQFSVSYRCRIWKLYFGISAGEISVQGGRAEMCSLLMCRVEVLGRDDMRMMGWKRGVLILVYVLKSQVEKGRGCSICSLCLRELFWA